MSKYSYAQQKTGEALDCLVFRSTDHALKTSFQPLATLSGTKTPDPTDDYALEAWKTLWALFKLDRDMTDPERRQYADALFTLYGWFSEHSRD